MDDDSLLLLVLFFGPSSFFFILTFRWRTLLCALLFLLLVSPTYSTNQFESLFIAQPAASQPASQRSVYFHYTRRRRRRNKNKRWNEKSVVSLFLLGVHKLLSLKMLFYFIFKEGENISFLIR